MQILLIILLSFSVILNAVADVGTQVKWQLIGPGDADQITSLSILDNNTIFAGTDIGGLYTSTDEGLSWRAANTGLDNLDITTPVVQDYNDIKSLFVGTRGGLFTSKDKGKRWQRVNDGLPVENKYKISGSIGSIVQDPKSPEVMFMGLGYRPSSDGTTLVRRLEWSKDIYKSTDHGNSWHKQRVFSEKSKVHQIIISKVDSKVIMIASNEGIYTSRNGGESWHRTLMKPAFNIIQSSNDPHTFVASTGSYGVYKSKDNGKTWFKRNSGLSFTNFGQRFNNRYSVLAVSPDSANTIYMVNSTWGRAGGAYVSKDFGDTWSKITDVMPESWLSTSKRMNTIVAGKKFLFLGSSRYLYRSADSGDNWQQLISKYTDGGWTHTGINVFGHTRTLMVDPENSKIYYAATADHGLVRSINSGSSWNPVTNNSDYTSDIWDLSYCKNDTSTVYAISSGLKKQLCLISSNNKGIDWSVTCNDSEKTGRDEKIIFPANDCDKVFVATKNGISTVSQKSKQWHKLGNGAPADKVYAIAISDDNPKRMFAAAKSGLYISDDKSRWMKHPQFDNRFVSSIYISPYDNKVMFVGTGNNKFSSGAIYKSEDGGRSWKKMKDSITSYVSAFSILPADHNIIYATSMDQNYHDNSKGSGVFISEDKGESWRRIDQALPVSRAYNVTTSELLPDHVFISVAGSGVYYTINKPE